MGAPSAPTPADRPPSGPPDAAYETEETMPNRPGRRGRLQYIRDNERQKCDVKECGRHRSGPSNHCAKHKRRIHRHGTPHGRMLWRREYAAELIEVSQFMTVFLPHHTGLQLAVEFLDDLLGRAAHGDHTVPGQIEFARLFRAGKTGRDCLEEVCSMFLFSRRRPEEFEGGIPLHYDLGYALLHAVPRYRRDLRRSEKMKPRYAKDMGAHVWDNLGLLLVNVASSIMSRNLQDARSKSELLTPFTEPPPND